MERKHRLRIKRCAAMALPSNKQEDFNVRLIELYGQHECLWNMNHADFGNVALKQAAWQKVANAMGAHLTVPFVKNCINELRYRINVSKLARTEYEMGGSKGMPPEKDFYEDKFAFLDNASKQQPLQASKVKLHNAASSSQASIGDASPSPKVSIASMVKGRLQEEQLLLNQRSKSLAPQSISSMLSLPLAHLRGQSVSHTVLRSRDQLPKRKQPAPNPAPAPKPIPEANSEDEELYRLHWRVRKQLKASQGSGRRPDINGFVRMQHRPPGATLYALDDDDD